jgi:hypothetical protein
MQRDQARDQLLEDPRDALLIDPDIARIEQNTQAPRRGWDGAVPTRQTIGAVGEDRCAPTGLSSSVSDEDGAAHDGAAEDCRPVDSPPDSPVVLANVPLGADMESELAPV